MAELLDGLRDQIAPLLDGDERLHDAIALQRMAELPGASGTAVKATKARREAFKELGVHQHMVWALTDRRLFIYKASRLGGGKVKGEPRKHKLWDAVLAVDLKTSGANIGNAAFNVKFYGLPLSVQGKESDVLRFTESLQRILYKKGDGPLAR
jgi:hypothetical protein